MKKVVFAAIAAAFVATTANALTIPSGSVLTTNPDGTQSVAPAHATVSGQRQLEQQGYVIGGGQVHVAAGVTTGGDPIVVSVDINRLVGLNSQQIRTLISDSAGAIAVDIAGVDASAEVIAEITADIQRATEVLSDNALQKFLEFDSYEDCVASGASGCAEAAAEIAANDPNR